MKNRTEINKTASVNDISADDFDSEIILSSSQTADDFEKNWVLKRKKKGSTVFDQEIVNSLTPGNHNIKNPKTLTRLGHGRYSEDTMTMIKFVGIPNSQIVNEVKKTLLAYSTIKRINLYACKSGKLPLQASGKPLSQRLGLEEIESKERDYYGQLSFAEYFILELEKSLNFENKHLPKDTSVVACLGDVKDNNGKVGVSGNKSNDYLDDKHTKIDRKSSLMEINCSRFLQYFKECCKIRRNSFFVSLGQRDPVSCLSKIPEAIAAKIVVNTKNPEILSEKEAYVLFSGAFYYRKKHIKENKNPGKSNDDAINNPTKKSNA